MNMNMNMNFESFLPDDLKEMMNRELEIIKGAAITGSMDVIDLT